MEVERRVQLAGSEIGSQPRGGRDPRLGNERPWRVVAVGHLAPLVVDLGDARPVPERMAEAIGDDRRELLGEARSGSPGALISPWATSIRNPSRRGRTRSARCQELVAHLPVVPVQVGLLRGEQVEVPLASAFRRYGTRCHADPPNIASHAFGGLVAVVAAPRPEDVARRSGAPGGGDAAWNQACWSDVWLGTMSRITRMPCRVRFVDQGVPLVQRAEHRLDVAVVGDVVAGVGLRRREPRIDPHRVDAEGGEVAELDRIPSTSPIPSPSASANERM